MRHYFLTCGLTGWCMEIIYTSLYCLREKNYKLIGNTSIWMFPIYGMASLLAPVCRLLKGKNIMLRGSIYTCGIFTCEYITGMLLKKHHLCPWDYSQSPVNINGVIRLDYAPFWLLAGVLFEHIVTRSDKT